LRALLAVLALVALVGLPAARACGYHDPASINVGMLNWAYPDALHVRTAVWMAQRDGVLARREPLQAADPLSAAYRFERMVRWRETQARLGSLRDRIEAAAKGQPMPAFAIVLIGSMLWTRFEGADGAVNMFPHATGPVSDDVVIVTDEPVVAALVEGRITAREARARGLVRLYGIDENVERISALLDRLVRLDASQTSQTQPIVEAR
jgi:uncharacterized small protein (DUF1192 family)